MRGSQIIIQVVPAAMLVVHLAKILDEIEIIIHMPRLKFSIPSVRIVRFSMPAVLSACPRLHSSTLSAPTRPLPSDSHAGCDPRNVAVPGMI